MVVILPCPLCELDLSKEKIHLQNGYFLVLSTKDLKGHKERIMVVSFEHTHSLPSRLHYDSAIEILTKIGKKVFKGAGKFVIMDSTFATINQHWHLVATDLDPKSEDFELILKTKWLFVVDC